MSLGSASSDRGQDRAQLHGVFYGLGAYLWWGFVPLYFRAVKEVPELEVLAFRVLGSVVLLAGIVQVYLDWGSVRQSLSSRKTLLTLSATTVLIAVNWLVFIWAVAHDQVLQASLGYYINPLVNMLLGALVLRERLTPRQWIAVGLAALGVGWLTWQRGDVPSVALVLAITFGLYGLLRKTARVESVVGLTIETGLLAPLALGYVLFQAQSGKLFFAHHGLFMDLLLLLAGVVTAVPLLWFTKAARRLRLVTMGFMQFIAPTLHFLLAVVAFREVFGRGYQVCFSCIWAAVVIYSVDSAWSARKVARLRRQANATKV